MGDEERSLVLASGKHFSREIEFLEDQQPRAIGSNGGDLSGRRHSLSLSFRFWWFFFPRKKKCVELAACSLSLAFWLECVCVWRELV